MDGLASKVVKRQALVKLRMSRSFLHALSSVLGDYGIMAIIQLTDSKLSIKFIRAVTQDVLSMRWANCFMSEIFRRLGRSRVYSPLASVTEITRSFPLFGAVTYEVSLIVDWETRNILKRQHSLAWRAFAPNIVGFTAKDE